ncbi:hypothetical protein Ahy_B05g075989 [Arachis hypogaea]|uniref:BED-type domain-containing protein n=1 Tax=Arachis hypogaea TaxID=3818 RepID=A0A444Z2Q3_ARAHY|nr:hypothetical protein Ahy_B05g075989 [Arachis hypogaea]
MLDMGVELRTLSMCKSGLNSDFSQPFSLNGANPNPLLSILKGNYIESKEKANSLNYSSCGEEEDLQAKTVASFSVLSCRGIHFEMSSTNIDVVAQDVAAEEQQQEPPVEATANFVPDESASIENSNKSSVKSVYWQYFSRFQEEKDWKAKCNHCKSILGANPRNGTTNLKNHTSDAIVATNGKLMET